jgi:hypothetical protein
VRPTEASTRDSAADALEVHRLVAQEQQVQQEIQQVRRNLEAI